MCHETQASDPDPAPAAHAGGEPVGRQSGSVRVHDACWKEAVMADDVVVLIALMMCCSVIGVLWPFVSIALRLLAAAAGLLVRLAGFLVRVVRGGAS